MPKSADNQIKTPDIATLRRTARRTRAGISQTKVQRNSNLLKQHFFSSSIYQKSKRIAFYYPIKKEAGSFELLTRSLNDGKDCFLPVINLADHSMRFVKTGAGTILKENYYGIPEPVGLCRLPTEQLDLILIPLLSFDRYGSRIGMGGGYYDRTLEFIQVGQYYRRPQLIGLAHDIQKQSTINPQAWDIPLDGVFTESGLKIFPKNY